MCSGVKKMQKAVANELATADIPVPVLRSDGAHASPSLLAYAAGRMVSAPRAALPSHGSNPQWLPFGIKLRNCKYSYGVSPGLSPGSFYPHKYADDDPTYEINTNFIAHL